jgi:hypothetical protein
MQKIKNKRPGKRRIQWILLKLLINREVTSAPFQKSYFLSVLPPTVIITIRRRRRRRNDCTWKAAYGTSR